MGRGLMNREDPAAAAWATPAMWPPWAVPQSQESIMSKDKRKPPHVPPEALLWALSHLPVEQRHRFGCALLKAQQAKPQLLPGHVVLSRDFLALLLTDRKYWIHVATKLLEKLEARDAKPRERFRDMKILKQSDEEGLTDLEIVRHQGILLDETKEERQRARNVVRQARRRIRKLLATEHEEEE
jgi:hypothetical protein